MDAKEIHEIAKELLKQYDCPNALDKHKAQYEATYGKDEYEKIEVEFGRLWFQESFPDPDASLKKPMVESIAPKKTVSAPSAKLGQSRKASAPSAPKAKQPKRRRVHSAPTTFESMAQEALAKYGSYNNLVEHGGVIARRIGYPDYQGLRRAAFSLAKARGEKVTWTNSGNIKKDHMPGTPRVAQCDEDAAIEKRRELVYNADEETSWIPSGRRGVEFWQAQVDGYDKHLYGGTAVCSCCGRSFGAKQGYRVELKDIYFCLDCKRLIYPKSGRGYMRIISIPMGNKR